MAATQQTLNDVLKEFYLGPVQEQLNNEVMVLDLMTKATVDWNGRVAIIPIHTQRNTGVRYQTEGGTLPPAGEQGYHRLEINAAFLYGRFQITGPAISAAGKGGANSFIGWMESEMDKLVSDVKSAADNAMISGGRVLGFLNQRRVSAGGVAPGVDADWEFFGDIAKAQLMLDVMATPPAPGVNANAVLVDLVRMDVNAANGYDILNTGVALTATNAVTREITLSQMDLNGVAGAAVDTSAVDGGFAIAVVVSGTQQTSTFAGAPAVIDAAGLAAIALATGGLDGQSQGIFGNLGSQAHFGLDRNASAVTTIPLLRSTIVTQDAAGGVGSGNRVGLTLPRIQSVFDTIHQGSDSEPDCILISPLARQQYAAMFQLTASTTTATYNVSGEKATNLDGGFSGLSYGNVPIKTARHVAQGGMIFMNLASWKVMELEGHGFADLDGSVLARAGVGTAGVDAYEGYYRWYYNTVCTKPNQNGILCGFTV